MVESVEQVKRLLESILTSKSVEEKEAKYNEVMEFIKDNNISFFNLAENGIGSYSIALLADKSKGK